MNKNMGTIDRIIRTVVAMIIVLLYLTGQISGTALIILGVIGVIFFLTSTVGYCPLYQVLNISTRKMPQ